MPSKLENDLRAERPSRRTTPAKGMIVGLAAGLAGTIVMDLFGFAVLLALGGPSTISFALIGDAAAAFLSRMGIELAGGAPLGAGLHYLIGLLLGAILGAAISFIDALHFDTLKKEMGLAILYVEAMSLPMLVSAAFALSMTPSETAQYFVTSFTMHLVFGGVLGLVMGYGLRSTTGTLIRHSGRAPLQ